MPRNDIILWKKRVFIANAHTQEKNANDEEGVRARRRRRWMRGACGVSSRRRRCNIYTRREIRARKTPIRRSWRTQHTTKVTMDIRISNIRRNNGLLDSARHRVWKDKAGRWRKQRQETERERAKVRAALTTSPGLQHNSRIVSVGVSENVPILTLYYKFEHGEKLLQ